MIIGPGGGGCQSISLSVRPSAYSAVSEGADMPFRRTSTTDGKPRRRDGQGWGGGRRQWDVGGVKKGEDVSYFDIPTVPFWLMNFHFRGQSMSVAATLV